MTVLCSVFEARLVSGGAVNSPPFPKTPWPQHQGCNNQCVFCRRRRRKLILTYLDKNVGLSQEFHLSRSVLWCGLLKRFDQQRVLREPRRQQELQAWNVFPIQQRILWALPNEVLKSPITFHNVFIDCSSIVVEGGKKAERFLPPKRAIVLSTHIALTDQCSLPYSCLAAGTLTQHADPICSTRIWAWAMSCLLQYLRFYLKPVSPLNWECKMSAMESTTGCCSCRSLSCSRNPKCSSEKFNKVKL